MNKSILALAVTAALVLSLSPAAAQIPQSASVMRQLIHDATWSGSFNQAVNNGGNLQIGYYTSTLTATYYPSGSYYQTNGCNNCNWRYSTVYYPPYGGTFLRAYVYLLWVPGGCSCGRRRRYGYLQKGTGATLYSGGNIGWAWVDFADYPASQGIRVAAYSGRRCWCLWTAYINRVEVLETRDRYYTWGEYESVTIDRDAGGLNGYDWGMIYWSASVPGGTSVAVSVRGASTVAGLSSQLYQNVAAYSNLNQRLGTNRYMQYKVRMTGPGSFLPSSGTPTFNWIRIRYYTDNNFNLPEAHDNEFWYDSTASFNESGADFNSSRVINAGSGLRLNQYLSTQTYWPAGSYYSTQGCNNCNWRYSTVYYPPNGGTFLRAYVYLLWVPGGCSCGRRRRYGYLQKGSGATVYSGGNIGWNWVDFTDYPASQGIRVAAYSGRRCWCLWTAYIQRVEVSELRYYTTGTYTSKPLYWGANGFSWAHISWQTQNTNASNTVTVQVAGAADSAFTMNVLGWTTVANDSNLATVLGADRSYVKFRVVFTGTISTTPDLDWLTLKYYTDAKPVITITSLDKGAGLSPPAVDNGWHDKPPVIGEPANDQPYSTTASNIVPQYELGINVLITDAESDPVKTVDWEFSNNFSDDGDDTNDMWYMIDAADMSWDVATNDITTTKAPGAYKIWWKGMDKYIAGIYEDLYFRLKAHDQIFASELPAVSPKFFVDANSPPTINAASFAILPDPAYTTDTLTLNTSASAGDVDTTLNNIHIEDDNNILTFSTSWAVNGVDIPGITQPVLPSSYFIKGDTVKARVYPYDGKEFGDFVETEIVIQNKPPVITSITLSPATPYTDDDLICTVVATDDDEFIWRETDFRSATVNNFDDGNGSPFDLTNCDGNITTTDVDQDNEWELQLK